MSETRVKAVDLRPGMKLVDFGEVDSLVINREEVLIRYRNGYTPPELTKSIAVRHHVEFILAERSREERLREAIGSWRTSGGYSLAQVAWNRHGLTYHIGDFVLSVIAAESAYSITQILFEAVAPDGEQGWVGAWTDGPHDGFEVFETQAEAVSTFMSELARRAEEEGVV